MSRGRRPADGSRQPPRALRLVLLLLVLAAVVVLLFTVVFPWFDATFVNDPVLGGGDGGPPAHGD